MTVNNFFFFLPQNGIFRDLRGCLRAARKGHFVDLWLTRLNDVSRTGCGQGGVSLMLTEKTVLAASVPERERERGVSIPPNPAISATFRGTV